MWCPPMSSLSTRSGTHHACPQGISSPLLRPRSSPVWGGGGAWPAGGQGPASIPALQLCPLVTSNTHTRGGSPFLPTGGAVRPAPSPLPASGSSGCAPEPTHAHTHVPGTPHVHMPHARTHAAGALGYLGLQQPHTRCFLRDVPFQHFLFRLWPSLLQAPP